VNKLITGILIGLALAGVAVSANEATITVALIAAGAGWSLATSAALIELHRNQPSRTAMAAHDTCILTAGISGAMAAGQFV